LRAHFLAARRTCGNNADANKLKHKRKRHHGERELAAETSKIHLLGHKNGKCDQGQKIQEYYPPA
jgi:hypothetical protein